MQIYFEDGKLISSKQLPIKPDFIIDAGSGVTDCIHFFDMIQEQNNRSIIYTNSIFAFSNRYAWNAELKRPEIYIRAGEHAIFTNITELTTRKLKEGYNLAKLYISGEFNTTDKNMSRDIKYANMAQEYIKKGIERLAYRSMKPEGNMIAIPMEDVMTKDEKELLREALDKDERILLAIIDEVDVVLIFKE